MARLAPWCRLALALLVLAPLPALASSFRVVRVAANDVLNVREAPNHRARALGQLPPDARGITVLTRRNGWAEITAGDLRGWVNATYLAAERAPPPPVAAPVQAEAGRPSLAGTATAPAPLEPARDPPAEPETMPVARGTPARAAPAAAAPAAAPESSLSGAPVEPQIYPVRRTGQPRPALPPGTPLATAGDAAARPTAVAAAPGAAAGLPGYVPAHRAPTTFFPDRLVCRAADASVGLDITGERVSLRLPGGAAQQLRYTDLRRRGVHHWTASLRELGLEFERNALCQMPGAPPSAMRITLTQPDKSRVETCCTVP
jgi:hypothetical protein